MKQFVRVEAGTDPRYGKAPEDRTIDELLMAGVVPLDKPSGPTSHQVAAWLRDALQVKHIGHGGTLDPNVTGVLPVAIGRGPKVVRALLTSPKEYITVMRLHEDVDPERILNLKRKFTGPIQQMPPVRSAVKRRTRTRTIYELDIMEIDGRDVLFRALCQAGTYIRTLCMDMGRELGTKAHMQELRRSKTGAFRESDLVTLHDVLDARILRDEDPSFLQKCIHPIERVVEHMPKIFVRDTAIDAICHGAPLAAVGVARVDGNVQKAQPVAMMSLKGELVGLAKADMSAADMVKVDKGLAAIPERVLMPAGTYPRGWK